jgi:outer membrane protein W
MYDQVMKNFIIISALIIALSGSTLSTRAQQGEVRMTASLAGATPAGSFKDLVDKTNLRGADITILYGFNDRLSGGLSLGFQDFYQKFPRDLYKLSDGSDISAVITHSIQTMPFLATARYHFMPAAKIQPYASLGAGGSVVINRQFIGEYPNEDTRINVAARPGLGIYIPFKKEGQSGINLGVNYTYISYKQDAISNLGFIGFNLGIDFPMRD